MFTNDATNTWFIFNSYLNSLSTLSRNIITPLGFSATLAMVGSSISSSWTQSVNATTYTVSYYFTNTNANTGGTLIQTVSGITTLFNSITTIPNISYYYYITITAINTAGQLTITSPTTQPLLLPVAPTNVELIISAPYLYCYWSAQPYTLYYNISFYQTTSQVTSGGTNIQNASNITTTYFLGSFQIINEYYYYAIVTALNMSGSSTNVASSVIFSTIIPINPVSATIGFTVNDVNLQGYWLQTINTDYYTMKIFRVASAVTTGGTLYETITNITGLTAIGTIPLLNSFYYYITVTSTNAYGSSSEIAGPFTTILILNRPSSVGSVTMTNVGVNAVATWTTGINASTYTIIFYEVATPTPSGGTIFQTFTGNVGLTQTSSRVLINGNYYYAIVRGVNTYGTDTGITSSNTTTQIANPPQPPTSVTVDYNSGGLVSSSWVAGLNTISYTVTFYYTTSNTPINGTVVETNTTSGLTNSMSATALAEYYYYATVRSNNTYGSSLIITSVNVAVITLTPPSPATNVTISTSGYYAVCTWTTGINTATYTVIFYYNSSSTTTGGTSFETITLLPKTTTTITSTIVMPNGYYIYAVVTAINPYTSTSTPTSSTTSLTQFAPTNPSNISITYSTINNAIISWTASSLYVTSYDVILYNNGSTNSTSGGNSVQTYSPTGTSVTSTVTLINSNYYYATVTAYSSVSNLYSSTIITPSALQYSAYVLESGAITFNSLSGLTGGSITITSPAQFATGYRIYISTTTTPTGFSFTTTTTGSPVSFTGATLQSSITYYAVLVPFNANGNSSSYSFSLGISTSILPTGGSVTTNSFSTSGGSVNIVPSNLATSYLFYISTTTNIGNAVYSTTINVAKFSYTGQDQSYVVPANRNGMSVNLYGAGGTEVFEYGNGGTGGPGGFVSGTISTVPGETLTMIVGLSGQGYGGGGGNNQGYSPAYGGGRAAIRRGGGEIVTAGGGGGAGYTSQGGAGGGLIGGNGSTGSGYGEPWGIGGTQTAGGGRSDNANIAKGGQFFGGNPDINGTSGNYMGGGGSGWFGGGGGSGGSSGGGGSSYIANLSGTVVNTQGGGAPQNTNARILIYDIQSISSYTFSSDQFLFNFSTSLSTGLTYYAIVVPRSSDGNGVQFVSSGRTV